MTEFQTLQTLREDLAIYRREHERLVKKNAELYDRIIELQRQPRIRVWPISWRRIHFAVRVSWCNFGLGFALEWGEQVWLTIRVGPLFFDVAYGDKQPHWR